MKKIHLVFLMVSALLSSCLEELNEQQQFVKILGEEGDSFGKRIRELPNGDLLIVGATEVNAFDSDFNFLLRIEESEVDVMGVPSITRTDRVGNVLLSRAFPIGSFIIAPGDPDLFS